MKKTVMATAFIIGASTLIFQGLTHAAAQTEYNKRQVVPADYANDTRAMSESLENRLPKGYQKANYTVETIDLEYYHNQTPGSMDMNKEEAAEIGARALWSVYGASLEGAVIEMGYEPANDHLPRSRWFGDVTVSEGVRYFFYIDSVTGELFSLGKSRRLDEKISAAFDPTEDKNPQEYVEVAREWADQLKIVSGPVVSVEYQGQGHVNHEPSIMLEIRDENGEVAQIVLSRYDKSVLSIAYHASYQYTLENIKKIEQQLQHITVPFVDKGKEPTLQPYLMEGGNMNSE